MGFGILVPMDSPIGMLFGLFAILIIIFFIILLIVGVFSSVLGGVIDIIGIINDEKDLWYHKKDKSNGIAFLCSLMLPFSGNLYLKENKFNLATTALSVIILLVSMWGLLTIPDFYYHNGYVITILVALWIISLISLGINIKQYNKYKQYYSPNKNTELESICGNKLFIAIPIIVLILFLSVNFMAMNDTSDRLYQTDLYSVEYPYTYAVSEDNADEYWVAYGGDYKQTSFDKIGTEDMITICVLDQDTIYSTGYISIDLEKLLKAKKTMKIDGKKASKMEDESGKWTKILIKNNGKIFEMTFSGETQNDMDSFINSFKFK